MSPKSNRRRKGINSLNTPPSAVKNVFNTPQSSGEADDFNTPPSSAKGQPQTKRDIDDINVSHRTRLQCVFEINEKLSPKQRNKIDRIGFGAFTRIKCKQMDKNLVKYIIKNFDLGSKSLIVHGTNLKFDADLVLNVFGLYNTENETDPPTTGVGLQMYSHLLCNKKGEVLPLKDLLDKLKSIKTDGDDFAVLYSMFLFSAILFTGTRSNEVFIRFADYLTDMEKVRSYNWGQIVLSHLFKGIDKVKNHGQAYVTGCPFLLLIAFVNMVANAYPSLLPRMDPNRPLVEQWDQDNVAIVIQHFTNINGFHPTFDWPNATNNECNEESLMCCKNCKRTDDQLVVLKKRMTEMLGMMRVVVGFIGSSSRPNTPLPFSPSKDHRKEDYGFKQTPHNASPGTPSVQSNVFQTKLSHGKKTYTRLRQPNIEDDGGFETPITGQKKVSFRENPKWACSYNVVDIFKKILTKIPIVDDDLLSHAWGREEEEEDDDTVLQYNTWSMTRLEMKTLKHNNWLCNAVMDFIAIHIWEESGKGKSYSDWVLPAWFSGLLINKYPDDKVKDWVFGIKSGIFRGPHAECRRITIPISANSKHWYICVVDIELGQICIYDSFTDENNSDALISEIASTVVTSLESVLHSLSGDPFSKSQWATTFSWCHNKFFTQQQNDYDCGLYVCLQMLFPDQINRVLHVKESEEARKRLACMLLTCKSFDSTVLSKCQSSGDNSRTFGFWLCQGSVQENVGDWDSHDIDVEKMIEELEIYATPPLDMNQPKATFLGLNKHDGNYKRLLDTKEKFEEYVKEQLQDAKLLYIPLGVDWVE